MDDLEQYFVEESFSKNLYRRKYMFPNGYGLFLLENIMDNKDAINTWNVFVIKKEEYDPEQDQDYSFVFDMIDENRMRNITMEDIKKIAQEVKNNV